MPTRRELDRRDKQRRGENPAFPDAMTTDAAAGDEPNAAESPPPTQSAAGDEPNAPEPPPPTDPAAGGTAAYDPHATESYAGRPDQGVTDNTGTGAGGATEWGGGAGKHPSRITSRPPGSS